MTPSPATRAFHRSPTTEPVFVRWLLIAVALLFMALFLVIPLMAVFAQAFSKGIGYYLHTLASPNALSAIKLTCIAAGISVPLNCIFGVAAAWDLRHHPTRPGCPQGIARGARHCLSDAISRICLVCLFRKAPLQSIDLAGICQFRANIPTDCCVL